MIPILTIFMTIENYILYVNKATDAAQVADIKSPTSTLTEYSPSITDSSVMLTPANSDRYEADLACSSENVIPLKHLPVFEGRGRCKRQGCKGISSLRCSVCKMHLCLTKSRNCFFEFHSC